MGRPVFSQVCSQMFKLIFSAIFIVGLSGCSAFAESETKAVPAVLMSADANSTSQLEQAIASLLNTDNVKISPSAFVQSSLLAIERAPHKDATGQLIMGRTYEMPQMVQLYIQDDKCSIKLANAEQSRQLPKLKCKAE